MTRSSQVSPVNNWEQSVPGSDDNKDKGPQAETSMFMKQTSVAGPRYIHISDFKRLLETLEREQWYMWL